MAVPTRDIEQKTIAEGNTNEDTARLIKKQRKKEKKRQREEEAASTALSFTINAFAFDEQPLAKKRKQSRKEPVLASSKESPSPEPIVQSQDVEMDENVTKPPKKKKSSEIKEKKQQDTAQAEDGDDEDEAKMKEKKEKRKEKKERKLLKKKESNQFPNEVDDGLVPSANDHIEKCNEETLAQTSAESPSTTTTTKPSKKSRSSKSTPTEKKPPRFIVFVGNLPYTATRESVARHFASIAPMDIRMAQHEDTGKSKGYAFVEFDQFDKMKTALSTFHHSVFKNDVAAEAGEEGIEQKDKKNKSKKNKNEKGAKGDTRPRRINVELTAGGGGNAEGRKEKIRAKNDKLDTERKRKFAEAKAKEYEIEAPAKAASDKVVVPAQVVPQISSGGNVVDQEMHPSRRARMDNSSH